MNSKINTTNTLVLLAQQPLITVTLVLMAPPLLLNAQPVLPTITFPSLKQPVQSVEPTNLRLMTSETMKSVSNVKTMPLLESTNVRLTTMESWLPLDALTPQTQISTQRQVNALARILSTI